MGNTAIASHLKYVVITPVRDEVAHVQRTIASMRCQTILPIKWVIVDDGSTDGTSNILDACAANLGWIQVIHAPNRGHRAAGSGVMEAFHAGYAQLAQDTWDFIVKLDGDLSFPPDYFEKCLHIFKADARLGIGGGVVCQLHRGQPVIDSLGDPPFHVRGATKIYRRDCWERISPLARAPGWDTIDEVKANMYGWSTRTFKDIPLVQHKPTGSGDSGWSNWFKNGRANYMTGYHPIFMVAKCLRRSLCRPWFLQSIALWCGFCSGYCSRSPKASSEDAIRYLRREQVRCLLGQPSIYG